MLSGIDQSDWRTWPAYEFDVESKERLLLPRLQQLTRYHLESCENYRRICDARGIRVDQCDRLDTIPFLPVRLFKHVELKSIDSKDLFKVITSTGTAGQDLSRVFLDKQTALDQTRALVKIFQSFIGTDRLPMLIMDHPGVIHHTKSYSARGAGIRGLSNFGRDHTYALNDDDLSLNLPLIEAFLSRHAGQPVLIFGFTFMVWKYFVQVLQKTGRKLDLADATLIHGGGWKKLTEHAVDNATFKSILLDVGGIQKVHNFYGMAEQVGSVFVECEHGFLHAPAFADVIIRQADNWNPVPNGSSGLIQVLSVLPRSYPGHSLLTEDIGAIVGVDNCPCGRNGKRIRVDGRIQSSEIRGCSDTYTDSSIGRNKDEHR